MAVRAGVIGVGVHGQHHARILSSLENVTFVGVFDINKALCIKVANDYSTMCFDSLEQLLEHVDCVSVATPTSQHYPVVMGCLKRNIPILVEKPIASDVKEAEIMIAEAEKRNIMLSVGHSERFNSAYRSIRNLHSRPVFIESHRLSVFNPRGTDVAVVLDLMIHDIDIVLDMVQKPVTSVQAVGVSVVSDEVDIGNARLEFEGGCVANLTASRISQRKMRKVRMFQRNAYISMDFLTGETEIFSMESGSKPEAVAGATPQMMEGISYVKYSNDGANTLKLEITDFIDAVRNGSRPCVTGYDGKRALEVALLVMEGMEVSARRIE